MSLSSQGIVRVEGVEGFTGVHNMVAYFAFGPSAESPRPPNPHSL